MRVTLYIDHSRHTTDHVKRLRRALEGDCFLRGRVRFAKMRGQVARMDWRIEGVNSQEQHDEVLHYCQAIRDRVDQQVGYLSYSGWRELSQRTQRFTAGRTV